jgi:hypothetical protein
LCVTLFCFCPTQKCMPMKCYCGTSTNEYLYSKYCTSTYSSSKSRYVDELRV